MVVTAVDGVFGGLELDAVPNSLRWERKIVGVGARNHKWAKRENDGVRWIGRSGAHVNSAYVSR